MTVAFGIILATLLHSGSPQGVQNGSKITKAKKRRFVKASEANYEINGVLTIKGIAKDVTFPARIIRNDQGYEATGKIDLDRTRWDIRYGSGKFFDNLGDKMIHDLFTLKFSFQTEG